MSEYCRRFLIFCKKTNAVPEQINMRDYIDWLNPKIKHWVKNRPPREAYKGPYPLGCPHLTNREDHQLFDDWLEKQDD